MKVSFKKSVKMQLIITEKWQPFISSPYVEMQEGSKYSKDVEKSRNKFKVLNFFLTI